jgi:hypothetical protein
MSENTIAERLALIEPNWADVTRRSQRLRKQTLRRQGLLVLGGVLAAAVLAGGAYAAARAIWPGQNLTPADIARQETVVTNGKWAVCSGHNQCTTKTGTHKEVTILPSMGVVFVLPEVNGRVGYSTYLVPGDGIGIVPEPPSPWGAERTLGNPDHPTGGAWTVRRPDGSMYTVTWRFATGAVTERITTADGQTSTIPLPAGDVVPLIPGSLANEPRTLDKAVTFDLPTGNRVIIFPQLNETYIDFPGPQPGAEPFAPGEAAKYGLVPIGRYNGKLPITPTGGTWTAHADGVTSTVTWHAGDSDVAVSDTTALGTTRRQVPIGHELPLVPFK